MHPNLVAWSLVPIVYSLWLIIQLWLKNVGLQFLIIMGGWCIRGLSLFRWLGRMSLKMKTKEQELIGGPTIQHAWTQEVASFAADMRTSQLTTLHHLIISFEVHALHARINCQNAAHHLLTESQSSQQPSVHEFLLIMWVPGVQGMSPSWFFRYELTLLSGSTWIGLMSSSLTYKYRLIGRYSKRLLARTQFQFNLHCYDLATLD